MDPSGKTKSIRVILIVNYKRWVSEYLLKASELALFLKVIYLFDEANGLIEKMKMDLSVQEEQFARQLLATQAIPCPKLIIKYHKKINNKEEL